MSNISTIFVALLRDLADRLQLCVTDFYYTPMRSYSCDLQFDMAM